MYQVVAKISIKTKISSGEYTTETVQKDVTCFTDEIDRYLENMIVVDKPDISISKNMIKPAMANDHIQELYRNALATYDQSYEDLSEFYKEHGDYLFYREYTHKYCTLSYTLSFFGDSISTDVATDLFEAYSTLSDSVMTKGMLLKLNYLYNTVCVLLFATEIMKRNTKDFYKDLIGCSHSLVDLSCVAEKYRLCPMEYEKQYNGVRERFGSALESFSRQYPNAENSVYKAVKKVFAYIKSNMRFSSTVAQLQMYCNSLVGDKQLSHDTVIDSVFIPDFFSCLSDSALMDSKRVNTKFRMGKEGDIIEEESECQQDEREGCDEHVRLCIENRMDKDDEIVDNVLMLLEDTESEEDGEDMEDRNNGEDEGTNKKKVEYENGNKNGVSVRRSGRRIKVNPKYGYRSLNQLTQLIGLVSQEENKSGSNGSGCVRDNTMMKMIEKEDKKVKSMRMNALRKSCDGEMLVKQLRKGKIDSSVMNTKKMSMLD